MEHFHTLFGLGITIPPTKQGWISTIQLFYKNLIKQIYLIIKF